MSQEQDDRILEELLRRRTGNLRPAGGPGCGDPEMLAAYAEGGLAGGAREDFERHLAACGACGEAVARLVRLAPRGAAAPEPSRWRAWWRGWVWAAPVMAGVALVGSLAWFGRERIVTPPTQEVARVATPTPVPVPAAEEKPANEAPSRKPTAEPRRGVYAPAPVPAEIQSRQEKTEEAGQKTVAAAAAPVQQAPLAPAPAQSQVQDQVKVQGQMQAPAQREQVLVDTEGKDKDAAKEAALGGREARADKAAAPVQALRAVPAQNVVALPGAAAGASLAKKAAFRSPPGGPIVQFREGPEQTWVLLASGRLLATSDAGKSWRVVATPEPVRSFTLSDDLKGEIVVRSGKRFTTTDGGKNWSAKEHEED